jgi:hypothetical protein
MLVNAYSQTLVERLGVEEALIWTVEAGLWVARGTQVKAAYNFVAIERICEAADTGEFVDRSVRPGACGVEACHLAIIDECGVMAIFFYDVRCAGCAVADPACTVDFDPDDAKTAFAVAHVA